MISSVVTILTIPLVINAIKNSPIIRIVRTSPIERLSFPLYYATNPRRIRDGQQN
jgi:hypothetical protein